MLTEASTFALASLVAAFFGIAAAVVVSLGARDRVVGRSLAATALCGGLWSLQIGLQSIADYSVRYASLISLLHYFVFAMPAVVFHTAAVWSESKSAGWKILEKAGYLCALLLIGLDLQGLLLRGFITYPWGAMARPGPYFWVYTSYSTIWYASAVVMTSSSLRADRDSATKLRSKYFLLAVAPAVAFGMLDFLPNYGFSSGPLGGIGCIAFVAVMSYAAVRHRLMDIDVFVIRVCGAILSLAAVMTPVMLLTKWAHFPPPEGADPLLLAIAAGAVLGGIAAFNRIRPRVQQAIEGLLFPSRVEARRALETFSNEVVELTHRDLLGQELTSTLVCGVGVVGAALYTRTGTGGLERRATSGSITCPTFLPALLEDAGVDHPADWEACVPIGSNGDTQGLIALGRKASGAAIDAVEQTMLTMLASQVAVALKNIEYVRQVEAQKSAIERQRDAIERQKQSIEQQKAEIEELQRRLQAENTALRAEVRSVSGFGDIVGSSPALQRVLALIEKTARSDASILVTGETGTGKELIARAVHELSERRAGPLISVNCPAIPHDLAEAELFGCERGAFTGASESRPGRFELADGGTLFLDEVADLPLAVQTKLLRVLQEREIQRLGSRRARKVDVRVVAASNHDLRQAIACGEFRADLYHRLAGIVAALPPLRDRTGDIEMLATYFLDRAAKLHRKPITAFSEESMRALRCYNWPGNIRELQNVVERAVLLCDGDLISAPHLGDLALPAADRSHLGTSLREEKLRRVQEALAASGGNQSEAARRLGMTRSNLGRLMKSLGLRGPRSLQ